MDDNPFAEPDSDSGSGAWRVPVTCCPACGCEELEPGTLRSAMSMDWHPGHAIKTLRLVRGARRLSRSSLSKGALIRGQRCVACGLVLLPPADARAE